MHGISAIAISRSLDQIEVKHEHTHTSTVFLFIYIFKNQETKWKSPKTWNRDSKQFRFVQFPYPVSASHDRMKWKVRCTLGTTEIGWYSCAVLTDIILKAASDVSPSHSLAWNRFDFIKLVCCDVGIEPNEESSERWRCYSRHHSFVATQFYSLCYQYCVRDHVFVVCLILRFDSTIRAEPHKILSIWTWRDWGVRGAFFAVKFLCATFGWWKQSIVYIFDGLK